MTRSNRDTTLFWLTAIVVLAAGMGLRDPWPADEPRFALIARQMVESGDWLFPHRGPELYSDKPPLFMWLQAATYTLVREWRVAFLMPSLLAALGTLWCVVDLGKRLWTRQAGLYAGYALLFALQFTYQAKRAQIDPLVTFWITLSLYGLLRHVLRGPDWRMWALGFFAAGLGTITKGVGALALLVLLPAAFAAARGWPRVALPWRDARAWLGPLAFVVAVSLWLVPMLIAALSHPDPTYRAYVDDILFHQTAGRYTHAWGHHRPLYYFLVVIATMWLPLALTLPWAIPAWRRRLGRRDPRILLPLAFVVLLVAFFSISSGKRDMYILPALPMACLALAPLLGGLRRRPGVQRALVGFVGVLSIAAVAAGLTMLFGTPAFEVRLLEERGLADASPLAALIVSVGAWGLATLAWHGRRRAHRAVAWMLGGTWVLVSVIGYPLLNATTSSHEVLSTVSTAVGPDGELGLVAWKEQTLLMARPHTATFGFKAPWPLQMARARAWQAEDPARRWLLVREPALDACVDRRRARDVGTSNRRHWWLVPASAMTPGCVVAAPAGTPVADDEAD